MRKAIDCVDYISTQTASELEQNGVEVVFGYLGKWSKCLTPQRLQILRDAKLLVGFFYEGGGQSFSESIGIQQAKDALAYANILGIPQGVGICVCVDYDMQPSDYPLLDAYLNGWKKTIAGKYETGLYGGYDVIDSFESKVDYIVQTSAWSGGRRHPRVAMYQDAVSTTLCGISVDVDEVYDTSILLGGKAQYSTYTVLCNGHKFSAIAVNNDTYVLWSALEVFHTPHTYKGNGVMLISGQDVQGVVYNGDTYLPWKSLSPNVKPQKVSGNVKWSFTTN